MSVSAMNLEKRIRALLLDSGTKKRFQASDILAWLNEALHAIVTAHPLMLVTDLVFQTRAQPTVLHKFNEGILTLPTGADSVLLLVDIDGAYEVSANLLDREVPGWRNNTANAESGLTEWARYGDSRDGFYSYPAMYAATSLVLKLALKPSAFVNLGETNALLRSEIEPLLVDYVVSRALAQDGEAEAENDRSVAYMAMYDKRLAELKAEDAARWTIST